MPDRPSEDFRAEPGLQFGEQQGSPVVADGPHRLGLGLTVIGRGEGRQRDDVVVVDVIEVGDDPLLAVRRRLAPVGAIGMIGEIGREAFAPVAPGRRDLDAVAEPGVEDFMAERGLADEGQPQDLPPHQGEGRQAEPGRQPVGDDNVMVVGEGADLLLVALQVAGGRFQIGRGQFPLLREEQGVDLQPRPHLAAGDIIRGGNEVQVSARLGEDGDRRITFRCQRKAVGFGDGGEARRQFGPQREPHLPVRQRMPEPEQDDAVRVYQIVAGAVDLAAVGDVELALFFLLHQLQSAPWSCDRNDLAAVGPAQQHAADRQIAQFQLQPGCRRQGDPGRSAERAGGRRERDGEIVGARRVFRRCRQVRTMQKVRQQDQDQGEDREGRRHAALLWVVNQSAGRRGIRHLDKG